MEQQEIQKIDAIISQEIEYEGINWLRSSVQWADDFIHDILFWSQEEFKKNVWYIQEMIYYREQWIKRINEILNDCFKEGDNTNN